MLRETPARARREGLAPRPERELHRVGYSDFAKSVLDVALCIVILLPMLLLVAVIAALVLIDSGRPIFFVQERVGRGGRVFRMYKFRTLPRKYDSQLGRRYMQEFVRGQVAPDGSPPGSRIHKPIRKEHITRVGRVLRRTSLDELPQIVNVLRREMSLVGPRPNVAWEVEAYLDWHRERLGVLPGITGLAQVRGRSAIGFDDIVRYDIEYARNQSLKLDLQILWWTVLSVLFGRGAS